MTAITADLIHAANTLAQHGLDIWNQEQIACFQKSPIRFNYTDFCQRTRRATAPLTSAYDLLAYNALYASRHIARLRALLGNSTIRADADEIIRIFDHGCGQGLASLVLLETLQKNPQSLTIELHLVEPSALALDHALYYVKHHPATQRHTVNVITHQDRIGSVYDLSPVSLTLHLFSNVLDMAYLGGLNLDQWAMSAQQQPGEHVCMAVSPCYKSGELGFRHLQALVAHKATSSYLQQYQVEHSFYHIFSGQMMRENGRAQLLTVRF